MPYTMDAKEGDKTRLERGVKKPRWTSSTRYRTNRRFRFTPAPTAAVLGPVTPDNRDQAKQLVQGLGVTSLSTDFFPGMRDALDAARNRNRRDQGNLRLHRHVQRAGFERQQGALQAKCDEIRSKPNRNLVFVRCGNPGTPEFPTSR